MKSPTPDSPLPVLRCADDFTRRFGKMMSGRWLLKSLVFGLCLTLGLVVAQWLGGKLQVVPVLAGMAWAIWQCSKVWRFFAAQTCPHCGKPVGLNAKLFRRGNPYPARGGILHLRCRECGGEAETDLRIWAGAGWPEKVS